MVKILVQENLIKGEKTMRSKSLLFTFVVLLLAMTQYVMAYPLNLGIVGNFAFTDTEVGVDTFRETLTFSGSPLFANSGAVSSYDALDGAVFNDAGIETAAIAPLTLIPIAGESFTFSPTTYTDGFKIFDNDGSNLLIADLTVMSLTTVNSTGYINTSLAVNLANIRGYGVYGGSNMLTTLVSDNEGIVNFSLQDTSDLSEAIINAGGLDGSSFGNTYSASVSTAPVPEPTTMLLFGIGLLGTAVSKRKKTA